MLGEELVEFVVGHNLGGNVDACNKWDHFFEWHRVSDFDVCIIKVDYLKQFRFVQKPNLHIAHLSTANCQLSMFFCVIQI